MKIINFDSYGAKMKLKQNRKKLIWITLPKKRDMECIIFSTWKKKKNFCLYSWFMKSNLSVYFDSLDWSDISLFSNRVFFSLNNKWRLLWRIFLIIWNFNFIRKKFYNWKLKHLMITHLHILTLKSTIPIFPNHCSSVFQYLPKIF